MCAIYLHNHSLKHYMHRKARKVCDFSVSSVQIVFTFRNSPRQLLVAESDYLRLETQYAGPTKHGYAT